MFKRIHEMFVFENKYLLHDKCALLHVVLDFGMEKEVDITSNEENCHHKRRIIKVGNIQTCPRNHGGNKLKLVRTYKNYRSTTPSLCAPITSNECQSCLISFKRCSSSYEEHGTSENDKMKIIYHI